MTRHASTGQMRAGAAVIGLSSSFALVGGFASFFMPVFLKESLGFSGATIGLLYAALCVTSLVSAVPAGLCNDRMGSRWLVAAALALAAASVAGLAWFRSLWLYLPLYVFYGLATNVFRISVDSLFLRDEGDPGRFGLYAGTRLAGIGAGTLASGLVLARLGFPETLLLLAALTAALCLVCPVLPRGGGCASKLSGYGEEFLGRPAALFFALWLFLYTAHWGAEFTSYGLFLRTDLGLGLASMGYFMTAQFAVVAAAAWWAGRLLRSGVRPGRLLASGLFLSGIGAVLMAHPSYVSSFIFRGVHEVGDGFLTVVIYVRIKDLFGSQRIGGHLGMVQFVSTLGSLCGSLAFGPLGERLGYGTALAASGLITLCLLPLQALWERRVEGGIAASAGAAAPASGLGRAAGPVARRRS
jgi:MFS family permease